MKHKHLKGTKGVIYSAETSMVDMNTGETHVQRMVTKRRVSKEPDFVKLYLDDVMKLNDIPKKKTDVLYLLLKKMNYENEITIVASHKRAMAEELACSVINIDKTLALLVSKGVLVRKDRGVFLANPLLFGKGSWQDIEELRLQLRYNKRDGKQIGASVSKDDNLFMSSQTNMMSILEGNTSEEIQGNSESGE